MLRRLFLSVLLTLPLGAEAETLKGKVVGVTDGDTIKVLVEKRTVKVRLAEIDTPERGQPWASRAKQALSDKVFRKQVEVRVVDTDRYGRPGGSRRRAAPANPQSPPDRWESGASAGEAKLTINVRRDAYDPDLARNRVHGE